jgi:hypothetical protein
MARLVVEHGDLVLRFSRMERLGAFHGDLRVPLSAVEDVRVSRTPMRELRGLRAPGTGFPRRIALGTWRSRGGKDLVALYRDQAAVIVRLRDQPFQRLLVSADDADAIAAEVCRARDGG